MRRRPVPCPTTSTPPGTEPECGPAGTYVAPTVSAMPNETMRDMWNRYGGPAWTKNRDLLESAFAPLHQGLCAALEPVTGALVLDVGCGTGGLSQWVVERGGAAVGIDISETMIATATEMVPAGRFVVADAQVEPLTAYAPSGFDIVTSSFGVMFFDDPVAAFANLASATKPDGRLVLMCWREFDENPNFTLGTHLLVEQMPDWVLKPEPGAPGPTGLADRAHTSAVLSEAGWSDIGFEPFDATCSFSIDGSDGVEERLAVILGTTAGQRAEEQLIPLLGDDGWNDLLDDVRAELRASMVDGAVVVPCATWIVTARRAVTS
jgi:SAM-dependent methyltransferase